MKFGMKSKNVRQCHVKIFQILSLESCCEIKDEKAILSELNMRT